MGNVQTAGGQEYILNRVLGQKYVLYSMQGQRYVISNIIKGLKHIQGNQTSH